MKTITRMAAATATLLALGGTDARAQLIELPMGTSGAGDLTAHQIRVVQFALRDQNCYRGPISGRWTAATRNALQCARQRTNASDGTSLARELALWSAGEMTTRTMAGDVAPSRGNPSSNDMSGNAPRSATGNVSGNPSRNVGGVTTGNMAARDTTMRGNMPMRDTTMRSNMPMRDTTMRSNMAMRDSSAMRSSNMMRDSSAMRSSNMMRDSSAMRSSSMMRDSSTMRGTTQGNAQSNARSGMQGNMAGGSMLAMHLDSLVAVAETGLAGMPAARTGALLRSVETHLAGTPALADLGPEFARLRTQLATVPMDSAQVGRTMSSLSTRIDAAVASAPADMQARLRRLGTALGNEGRRLSP